MNLFEIQNMTHYFGGLRAVSDFNLSMRQGELFGLIGPNGAGKTTVFNLISGIYIPTQGTIMFDGKDITRLPPNKVSRLGIARTFQNIRIFYEMSVIDNIKVAFASQIHYSIASAFLHTKKFWEKEDELNDKCYEMLKLFNLEKLAYVKSSSLPYGQQRRLEIARALATNPKLLLLDEPAAGMNPQEAMNLVETIGKIRNDFHISILVIEHNMKVIMNISERIQVMDFGETIATGIPSEIQADPKVIEAYLGKEAINAA